MSMIYESQTLVSAMQTRVGQYKDLKEQLMELKKGFESIVHLDDELQGQGAEAIKGFYKAQIDVVDSWLRLINRHVAFLSGIQGDTIEANLSETVVTVPFLEEELTNATRNSKEMVTAQKNDLKKILAGIDDIIQLEPFSDDAFFENIEKAETKRTETIDKVNEIDHKWTTEYAKSEEDQAAVTALMEQLKVSSTRGGVVSPLYFNAAAYKNSEAYKNLEVRKKETAQYLKVKKEEAENRLIKDLKAQLDHVTDPDEFLKIAKQIGYENLAPTQQQYVMQLEAAKQTADIAKGIGVGLYDVGKDFVTGVWDFVTDPGETVEGVANSIMHPIKTYKYISKSISDSYERDMVNGDAYSRAHWVSYALGTVVTSVVGTKGAGAVAKTGVATTKAAAVNGVTKAKEFSIPNLLPYNPKNQLSLAGGVPYNVVNGVGLKDQLISMAKVESEVNGNVRSNPDHKIRTYRNADLKRLEKKYTADPRLTIEMPYVGKGQRNTNSEGWLRDKDYYWKEVMNKTPEYLSKMNIQKIELGFSPVNDKKFREHFPQYDIKELYNDTLIHHHIGGGGQAVAVPAKLHPGSGGIHNAEKAAEVWGNDSSYAELLEKFLNK
ncbi:MULTISPECIES: T7SS effector LXG polymorphic toxin [unclassified Bacillus (in: firmicutes)]|uniref:T7SS effector LXG polymorphic toxin n=1 Tax=unclassified Bacillus (in: firmicutes) TaxID=185979 RepID=UPI001BEB48D1|nr:MULTISPECIES: T7SS effector LXG polymorphic toxin [unclassified Bacillus (in: firmicutes)]MBT2616412.1 ribonuclease YeeF family protein [Bacillus sp. ISL-78]MBT2630059.1 ribonuclease YeeF family protein [Bacillus sp. ISL-101]